MLKWINKKRNTKGFTLIELIVVIAILGILAAIAIPRLTGQQVSAAQKAHDANLRTIDGAVAMFEAEHGILPRSIDDLVLDETVDIDGVSYTIKPVLSSKPAIPARLKTSTGAFSAYTLDTSTKKAAPLGDWTDHYDNTDQ